LAHPPCVTKVRFLLGPNAIDELQYGFAGRRLRANLRIRVH
jgi:hypothetical protein